MNCNTVDTDSSGAFICGADASGSANPADLIYLARSGTKYYTASSTATDALAWHFNNGFVSSGASSTISDVLYLTGSVNASSTLHASGNTWLGSNLFAGGTTSQPLTAFALGAAGSATADAYISGGLGVGNATTADGVLETSGVGFFGDLIKVKGTGTSTFAGGVNIANG